MNFWDLLNSPFILTLMTIVVGGFIASWLTTAWQKRSHQYQIRLELAQRILASYQAYVRLIRSNPDGLTDVEFDRLHSQLLAQAKIAKVVFTDSAIGEEWERVASRLASIRGLKMQDRDVHMIGRKLVEVYGEANSAIELMFNHIA